MIVRTQAPDRHPTEAHSHIVPVSGAADNASLAEVEVGLASVPSAFSAINWGVDICLVSSGEMPDCGRSSSLTRRSSERLEGSIDR
jgi:hypothetical protein